MANTSDNDTQKKADGGKPPRPAAVILSAMQQLSQLLGLLGRGGELL